MKCTICRFTAVCAISAAATFSAALAYDGSMPPGWTRTPPPRHIVDPKPAGPACIKISEVKNFTHGSTLHTMTLEQFHFAQGVYVGDPYTPEGLPPGDGAILATSPDSDNAIIIWTTKASQLACNPITVPQKFVDLLGKINTGPGDSL